MKQFLAIPAVMLLLLACNKDKFQTKPQLKLISVSDKVIPVNGSLKVVLQYTDKEGDVSDSIFITKQRMNARVVTPTLRDNLFFALPSFPNAEKGRIELNLGYQNELISAQNPPLIPGTGNQYEADTLNLKFVVQDKGGNKSDTVFLQNIVVLR